MQRKSSRQLTEINGSPQIHGVMKGIGARSPLPLEVQEASVQSSLIWIAGLTCTLRKSEDVFFYVSGFEERSTALTTRRCNPPTHILPRTLHRKGRHGPGSGKWWREITT